MKGVKTSPEIRQEIVAFRRVNNSAYEIARELGISVQTVYRVLREEGVQPLTGRVTSHLSNVEIGNLIERYLKHENVDAIRRDANISLVTLYQILDDAGVPRRHEQISEERRQALDDAVSMYQDDRLIWEIIEATGVSTSTLTAELHKRKIPLRRAAKREAARQAGEASLAAEPAGL